MPVAEDGKTFVGAKQLTQARAIQPTGRGRRQHFDSGRREIEQWKGQHIFCQGAVIETGGSIGKWLGNLHRG